MGALIRKIATYLVKNWNKLSGPVKWAIEQVAGWAIVEAIEAGVNAVIDFLSGLSDWVIEKIAGILGI
ncbi:TPA: hypothetical protein ACGO6Q_002091 [Streptococcus suis]